MKSTLTITSLESLDSAVAEVVRLKIRHAAATAEMAAEIAKVQKDHTAKITKITDDIAESEAEVLDYCSANREELFTDKKSRDTVTAVFGFEFTPYRVETVHRKVTWKEVIKRMLRLSWGRQYLSTPEPKVNKDALLSDRTTLTDAKCTTLGITFERDEQFFIRPKSEIAEATTTKS